MSLQIQTWFQNKRSRSRRGHRYLVHSTQNAAGEAAKHLKPKTTENDTSEPDGSSLRASFGKTSTSNSLFRPYDPDIGTGRTTDSNGDSNAQIGGHKLVGYVTVVNPHDGQCYLQPLPVSSRFTASSYRIVNPAAFFSGSSLMPSPLPTYMPFSSSMMLPISPSLSSYLPRSSVYDMFHMSGLKTAFLPLPTTEAYHWSERGDTSIITISSRSHSSQEIWLKIKEKSHSRAKNIVINAFSKCHFESSKRLILKNGKKVGEFFSLYVYFSGLWGTYIWKYTLCTLIRKFKPTCNICTLEQ